MRIEEAVNYVEIIAPVVAYKEEPHGVWLFVVSIDADTHAQVRIRSFGKTKINMALDSVRAAITKHRQEGINDDQY